MPRANYRIGLPLAGRWVEVLNTDARVYGGSDVGNAGGVTAGPVGAHGQPASARIHAAAARRIVAGAEAAAGTEQAAPAVAPGMRPGVSRARGRKTP